VCACLHQGTALVPWKLAVDGRCAFSPSYAAQYYRSQSEDIDSQFGKSSSKHLLLV
jgi:hypothetical protein